MANGLDKESRRFYRKESANDLTSYWDGGEHYASKNRWVFECAWEVANKGMYLMVSSNRKSRDVIILDRYSIQKLSN